MDNNKLFKLVNEVKDEESFLEFIDELVKDRIKYLEGKMPYEWKNETIEDFLECAHAWGEASKNGLEYYTKSENPWRRCAQIIFMGKIYE